MAKLPTRYECGHFSYSPFRCWECAIRERYDLPPFPRLVAASEAQRAFAMDRRAQMVDYLCDFGLDLSRALRIPVASWWCDKRRAKLIGEDPGVLAEELLGERPVDPIALDPRTASAILMACQDDGPEGIAAAFLVCRRLRPLAERVKQSEPRERANHA